MNLTSKKSGDNSEEVTPVPISNTVVKLLSADDTWWEAAWESRTLPVFYYLDLHRIEIKNCAQAQEPCDTRLFIGALAAIKPLVLPGVGKKTLVYVIKTSVL